MTTADDLPVRFDTEDEGLCPVCGWDHVKLAWDAWPVSGWRCRRCGATWEMREVPQS